MSAERDHETFHRCSVNDEEVRLMLWDTAGQEEFDAITKAYYRGETAVAPLTPMWRLS